MELKFSFNNEIVANETTATYKELYEGFFNLVFKYINTGVFGSRIDSAGIFLTKDETRNPFKMEIDIFAERDNQITNDAGAGNNTLPASFLVDERQIVKNELLGIHFAKEIKDIVTKHTEVGVQKQSGIPTAITAYWLLMNYIEKDTRVYESRMISDAFLEQFIFEYENTDLTNRFKVRYDDLISNGVDIQKQVKEWLWSFTEKDHKYKSASNYENESLMNIELIKCLFFIANMNVTLNGRSSMGYDDIERVAAQDVKTLEVDDEYGIACPVVPNTSLDQTSLFSHKGGSELKQFIEYGNVSKLDNKHLHEMLVVLAFKYGAQLDFDSDNEIVYKKEHGLSETLDDTLVFKDICGLLYSEEESVFKTLIEMGCEGEEASARIIKTMIVDLSFNNLKSNKNELDYLDSLLAETNENELLKSALAYSISPNTNDVRYLSGEFVNRSGADNSTKILEHVSAMMDAYGFGVDEHLLALFKDNSKETTDEYDTNITVKPKESTTFDIESVTINEKELYQVKAADIISFIKNKRSAEKLLFEIYEKVKKDYKPFGFEESTVWAERPLNTFYRGELWSKFKFNDIRAKLTVGDEVTPFKPDHKAAANEPEEFLSSDGINGRNAYTQNEVYTHRPEPNISTLDHNISITKWSDRDTRVDNLYKYFGKNQNDNKIIESIIGIFKYNNKFINEKDLAFWVSKIRRLTGYALDNSYASKDKRQSRYEIEEEFVNKVLADIGVKNTDVANSKVEVNFKANEENLYIDSKPRAVRIQPQKNIDAFISRREVATTIMRLMSSFVSKTSAPIGENDTFKFTMKKESTTAIQEQPPTTFNRSKPVRFNDNDLMWFHFYPRPLASDQRQLAFEVKEVTILPKPTSQDVWYGFASKSETRNPIMMDPVLFVDKRIRDYSLGDSTDIWANIWKTVSAYNDSLFSYKDKCILEKLDSDTPFERKMMMFEADDTAVLIAKKNELETKIQEIELLNQDKIAKDIVTNIDLTTRLSDPYQDFFDSFTFSYDELILPEQDFDYTKFKEQLVDVNGKPKAPIRTIDGCTFIGKFPSNHPIPKLGDVGREFVEIDGHLMKFMIEILYRIWQENIFKFGAMDMRESVERMLQYMNLFVDTRIPEQLHKQAKRIVQMFRWYGEYAILERGEFKISISYKDFIAPLHTGDIGIVNEMHNLEVSTKRIIEIINPYSDASIEFTFDNAADAIFRCTLMTGNGTCTIYLNNEIIKVTDAAVEKVELTIPTQADPSKLKIEFTSTGASTFNISAIRLSNYAYDDITTEYNPKPGLGNAAIDALIRRATDLSFALTSEEMAAEVEQIKNGNIAISEMVDKLVQYFNLHHQEKIKGKRLTIKH